MTFGEDARLYDRMRPGYPRLLFDDLVELTILGAGARVLEIGSGTGQATEALASRGFRVTALDLSADMAAVCAERCARFGDLVRIEVGPFEHWPATATYDLVFSATAFHWIDPEVRISKSAALLRPG